jgi:undecaprenyl-diphosphatase
LGGACVYKLAKAGTDDPAAFIASLGGPIPPAVGIVVAAFSAALAIKWLVGYLSKGGMAIFGWWRVALAAAFAVAVFAFGVEL